MTVLRFEITPKQGEKGTSEIIVGIGDPSKCCLQPKHCQTWFDVKAGDVLVAADGEERPVLKVRLFGGDGAAGEEIASGREWLRGRR